MPPQPTLSTARALLRSSVRTVFFTGSGISAESGIPTFRGPGGLWRGHRAEELATPEAFARDPQRVTAWYRWRRGIVAAAAPNEGHLSVAEWARRRPESVVVTQNVDGLHTRAGSPRVIELHGSLWTDRCARCEQVVAVDRGRLPEESEPPSSCDCGGLLRPGVVWFGEALPAPAWREATAAMSATDAVVVVGTSGVVQPAASLLTIPPPGVPRIEVDPEPVIPGAVSLTAPAAESLPALLR